MIVLLILTGFKTSANSDFPFKVNDTFEWQVTNSNPNITIAWYNSSFQLIGKVLISNNSRINLTITAINESNMASPVTGKITIGNLTTEAAMSEIAGALVLSIYPWYPGLLAYPNWTYQENQAKTAANGQYLRGTLTISNITYQYGSTSRKAIKFLYQQDPNLGNQNTTLIYDISTGVLLEGFTELKFTEYYVLGLRLEKNPYFAKSAVGSGFTLLIPIFSAVLLLLTLFVHRKRQSSP